MLWKLPISPEVASDFAREIDILYYTLWILTLIFLALVMAMLTVLTIRYRQGAKVNRSNPVDHNLPLELVWSVIPMILGLVIFAWGAKLYADAYRPPKNAKEIFVIGKQWMWHIQHANGVRENNELHLEKGKPFKLTMISQDVLHAFFIPAFRIKRDVIPGRYTDVWCTPTKVGEYHLFCAEYCGTQHSGMIGKVYVMEPQDYKRWLDSNGTKPQKDFEKTSIVKQSMEERGADLYHSIGCNNCHGVDDTRRGPSLYAVYGRKRPLEGGQTAVADRDYLREAILKPNDRLTSGYEPLMPTYDGQVKEEQVNELIAYIKSLGTASEPKMDAATLGQSRPTGAR